MLARLGTAHRDPAPAFRRRANADELHVLALQRLIQVGDVRYAERTGQPFIQLAPFGVDVGLVGDGDELAALVGGEGGGVVLLMRVATADEQGAVLRGADLARWLVLARRLGRFLRRRNRDRFGAVLTGLFNGGEEVRHA